MMVGGFVWGTLADFQGRRAVLLWSLSVNALGGLLSSFAQSTWLFILMRFVSGLGLVKFCYRVCDFYCKKVPNFKSTLIFFFWKNILRLFIWQVRIFSFSVKIRFICKLDGFYFWYQKGNFYKMVYLCFIIVNSFLWLHQYCVMCLPRVSIVSLLCCSVGGSMPVIFTYFCEFQPKHKRGAMISFLATFWMGGNILAAGTSY